MCSLRLVAFIVFPPLQFCRKTNKTRSRWMDEISLKRLTTQQQLTISSSKSSAKICMKVKSLRFQLTLDRFNFELTFSLTNQQRGLSAEIRQHLGLRTLRKLEERKCDVALTHNKNGKTYFCVILVLCLHVLKTICHSNSSSRFSARRSVTTHARILRRLGQKWTLAS